MNIIARAIHGYRSWWFNRRIPKDRRSMMAEIANAKRSHRPTRSLSKSLTNKLHAEMKMELGK